MISLNHSLEHFPLARDITGLVTAVNCKECQIKQHKKECKSGEAAKKSPEEETANKKKSCLKDGQSQHVLMIVSYLYHFAATSDELNRTSTEDAARVLFRVTPKFNGFQVGELCSLVHKTQPLYGTLFDQWRGNSAIRRLEDFS